MSSEKLGEALTFNVVNKIVQPLFRVLMWFSILSGRERSNRFR